MKPETQDWGLVEFDIKTDLSRNIKPLCQIAMSEHSKGASHYQMVTKEDGSTFLALYWYERPTNIALPFNLNTPELMSDFVKTWLDQKAVYPRDTYNGDGDTTRGIRICNHTEDESIRSKVDGFYVVAVVIPEYVIYSK